ncbi:MAG: Na(+)-translocating NADH-quinone reductase subunit A [Brumimicrobium sp.]|nr:Na(+)-translocating NADH-quinone reductase subunit A [Brumimicrobium sp.]MCO5268144.1 Na(+)-translocating NADH-quinone reductase subunit A [Brumimicrobium sp.]
MPNTVKLKKGLDIKLLGEADQVIIEAKKPTVVAIKPTDFHGLNPKVVIKEGEEVKRGQVFMYDKNNESVKFASPVNGTLTEIVRGEKRKILAIKINVLDKDDCEQVNVGDLASMSREQVKQVLLDGGMWPFLKQRPLDKIANPEVTPKAIFISSFDSAPLAPDYDFIMHDQGAFFQKGIDAIAKLTDGKVHLTLNGDQTADATFTNAKNVQINTIFGKHPAGNVGTQIHHFDPINKGEFVFTINPIDVVIIGKFFTDGKFDSSRIVALTGSEAKNRKYYKTIIGAQVSSIIDGNMEEGNVRVISGNALTGDNVGKDGFLGYYSSQITLLPEGNHLKFFLTKGWLGLGFDKYSSHRLFPTWITPNSKKRLDTNLNGEERGFVVTGEMEKVFPFDILPMYLIKAIIVNDIEKMEQLGIYEVAPEDFALCEYVCTSKIEIQDIVRKGLDVIEEECM